MEEITLEYVRIFYKEPIVYMTFKEGAELGVPEMHELIAYAEELSGKKPYVVLSDVRVNMDVTHEGRRLVTNAQIAPFNKGTAVVVKNSLYQYAANLFAKFNKPAYPYRVFTDKQKALDWLLKLPLV